MFLRRRTIEQANYINELEEKYNEVRQSLNQLNKSNCQHFEDQNLTILKDGHSRQTSLKEMRKLLNDKQDELEDCKESLELAHFKI